MPISISGSGTITGINAGGLPDGCVTGDDIANDAGKLCRAWVNFDGTTGAIRASYNVSSITRTGVGDYTVNFTTAMPDANYTVCCTQADGRTVGSIPYLTSLIPGGYNKTIAITSSSIRLYSTSYNGGTYDALYNYVTVFR